MSSPSRTSQGPSTRAVHAGRPAAAQGDAFQPPVTFAAPFHMAGDPESSPYQYGRYGNPTFTALEATLGALEGGQALVFGSGMAAVTAVLARLGAGDVLVLPSDGYFGVRGLEFPGLDVRLVPTDTEAIVAACEGAAIVWVETPSNPKLDLCDIATVAEAAHAAGALLVVLSTTATPLGQQPLALGADLSVTAGTKSLAGHSDLLLGVVAGRDEALMAEVLSYRSHTGAVPGPFEAWLAHRSVATLDLRLGRSSDNAAALAVMLRERDDVAGVWHPGDSPLAARQMTRLGPLVSFDLGTEARASAFIAACALVAEATSFGGVHSTAERRARWGTDDVGPGFIRFSAGIEDEADLLADVAQALDATRDVR